MVRTTRSNHANVSTFLTFNCRTRAAKRWHGLPSESFGLAVNTPTQTVTHSLCAASAIASINHLHCVVQAAWRILAEAAQFPKLLFPSRVCIASNNCCLLADSEQCRFSLSHSYCQPLGRFRIRIIFQSGGRILRVHPPGRLARQVLRQEFKMPLCGPSFRHGTARSAFLFNIRNSIFVQA